MFVAASTECFPDLSLQDAIQKMVDLEFTFVEIAIHDDSNKLTPGQVLADLDQAIERCRQTHRVTPVAYVFDSRAEEEEYYAQFTAMCRLAKSTKVVSITVPSAELGTPFNAEVERLQRLVRIATVDGILISVKTQVGRMSEDPGTLKVMCDNVSGLGVTLDPSHFIYEAQGGPKVDPLTKIETLWKYVYHVQLRDTSRTELQVRVGQGEVEYGRIVTQLEKQNYKRALCVDVAPTEGIDHFAEMRKLRLLLESLC